MLAVDFAFAVAIGALAAVFVGCRVGAPRVLQVVEVGGAGVVDGLAVDKLKVAGSNPAGVANKIKCLWQF
jgi:hypothetical protein